MEWKFRTYLICVLFVVGFIACGEDSDDKADKQPAKPTTSASTDVVVLPEIDYAVEEEALREVFTLHAAGIGTQEPDEFMPHWLRSESEDVFVAWDFWAGAFEKHLGWKAIKKGWEGIFRLRGGPMTVEFESVGIDKHAKNATLYGSYRWAVSGGFIASMVKKDRKDGWKIQQVDYTNKKFGDQVDELKDPAYINPPPEDDSK